MILGAGLFRSTNLHKQTGNCYGCFAENIAEGVRQEIRRLKRRKMLSHEYNARHFSEPGGAGVSGMQVSWDLTNCLFG